MNYNIDEPERPPPRLADRPWHEMETVRLWDAPPEEASSSSSSSAGPPPISAAAPTTWEYTYRGMRLSMEAEHCDVFGLASIPSDDFVVDEGGEHLYVHRFLLPLGTRTCADLAWRYGHFGDESRREARRGLLEALDSQVAVDVTIARSSLEAHKAILELRSPLLAANLKEKDNEVDLLPTLVFTPEEDEHCKPILLDALLKYLYTYEDAFRDAVVDAAFFQTEETCEKKITTEPPNAKEEEEDASFFAEEEEEEEGTAAGPLISEEGPLLMPLPLRAAYAFDERLFVELREATIRRIGVDVGNAASLWRFAEDFHDSSAAKKLRNECVEVLARPGSVAAAKRAVGDPELFEALLPESARRALEVVQLVSTSNPVARGARIADLREAVAVLRESLDEQVDRLASAETRQRQQDAADRAEDKHTTNRVWDTINKRRRAVDFLRDYVDKLEARAFHDLELLGVTPVTKAPVARCHRRRRPATDDLQDDDLHDDDDDLHDDDDLQDDDDDDSRSSAWTYEWRDVPLEAVLPPGLEYKLTFGGARRARVPSSWQLRLYIDDRVLNVMGTPATLGAVFRRYVGQTTAVEDVLRDLRAFLTPNGPPQPNRALYLAVAVIGNDGLDSERHLDPQEHFTPDLWLVRDRIELGLL